MNEEAVTKTPSSKTSKPDKVPNEVKSVPNEVKSIPNEVKSVPNEVKPVQKEVKSVPNEAKSVPKGETSDCRGKNGKYASVYSFGPKGWQENKEVCDQCFNFPNTTLKTPFGNTPIFIYEGKNDVWVSTEIQNKGTFESSKANLMYKILKEDKEMNLLDIGSNLGVYALSAAKLGRKVLAVEALARNLQHICSSVVAGQLQDSVFLVHNAVSNDHTEVSLGVDKNNMGGTFVDVDADHIKKLKLGRAQGSYGKIHTVTMDDILTLPIIDKFQKVFIKMDIEGFEARAVQKASNLFKKIKIVGFVMEWEFHKGMKTADTIFEFMKENKFKPYSVSYNPSPLVIAQSANWPYDVLWLPESKR
ncbi:hypothetical protein FSP39_017017 [Pinctada imbricata]|uniref:Methyltransferase FkbM domain-containing protein n=1 Tax=Pinctada imbricata TaxID=66713 RepID=A0AA88XJ56_PINIB|nr:hypothetical protein FSP39_017017 [Pinctada imbricata]